MVFYYNTKNYTNWRGIFDEETVLATTKLVSLRAVPLAEEAHARMSHFTFPRSGRILVRNKYRWVTLWRYTSKISTRYIIYIFVLSSTPDQDKNEYYSIYQILPSHRPSLDCCLSITELWSARSPALFWTSWKAPYYFSIGFYSLQHCRSAPSVSSPH